LLQIGINPTKEVKHLYNGNCKTLKKVIGEDTMRWKDLPCSWLSRINIVKIAIITESNL
jgi:hypothetical protein